MKVALFGEDEGDEAQQGAASFMTVIAKQYCEDILMPDDLYKRRDEMLRDKFGTDFKIKRVMKRPAAAAPDPTAEPSKAKAKPSAPSSAKASSAASKAPATGSAATKAPPQATQKSTTHASETPPKASSASSTTASPDLRVYLVGPPDFAKWL